MKNEKCFSNSSEMKEKKNACKGRGARMVISPEGGKNALVRVGERQAALLREEEGRECKVREGRSPYGRRERNPSSHFQGKEKETDKKTSYYLKGKT